MTTLYPKFINVPSTPHLLQKPLLSVPACPICIDPAPAPFGQTDSYIDDLISVCPSYDNNATRIAFPVPIVLEDISRPVSSEELPCSHIVSNTKLKAEGCPSKCQIVMGWYLNTWSLTISLPEHKNIAWLTDIDQVMQIQQITFNQRLLVTLSMLPLPSLFQISS